ncbi:NAD-dependent epimerase/dehydratase family protein [Clostridium sp. UBA7339]|uniref:NAD-dependent epimerase/dehydratase family protein n=1 Tax=Clostridium sp. UBA7339 TaxID=1946376 RepID=UPI003217BB2F
MKVMLVGGTGVLSKDIARQCIEDKIDLYMINRGKRLQYAPENVHVIIGDISNTIGLKKELEHLEFDVVVDFLSYTPKQMLKTLELFRNKCKQYIFISSATVYSKDNPEEVITEETPLTNYDWDYSKNKISCEKILEEESRINNLQYTIVRPYITYGTTRIPFALISKNKQWTLIDRILNDKPIVMWDDGKAICTLTHTEDFAKGVVGLFGNPNAMGQAFHITSDEHLSWQESLEKIADVVGKKVKIIHIPSQIIEKEIVEMRGELTGDKSIMRKFDNTKIKSAVTNFNCQTMFSEGIKNTIEHYESNPQLMSIDHYWNAQIDILIHRYYKKYMNEIKSNKTFEPYNSKAINNINYIKSLVVVVFYKIFNKMRWFLTGVSLRIKRLSNRIKI